MKTTTSRIESWNRYIPAIFGLVGVLVGSIVTGVTNYKIQELTNKADIAIETTSGSREMIESHIEAASSYTTSVLLYSVLVEEKEGNAQELKEALLNLTTSSANLAYRSSPVTAQKILECTSQVLRNESSKELDESALPGMLVSVYFDIAKYRWRATEEAGKDEMLKTLLELISATEKSNQPEVATP